MGLAGKIPQRRERPSDEERFDEAWSASRYRPLPDPTITILLDGRYKARSRAYDVFEIGRTREAALEALQERLAEIRGF